MSAERATANEPSLPPDLIAAVDAKLRVIVRKVLRVTLDENDRRLRNQDALDAYGDMWVKLLDALARTGDGNAPLHDIPSYAASIAYRRSYDELRRMFPTRRRLHDRLRPHFRDSDQFALWTTPEGEELVGLASWRDAPAMTSATAAQLNIIRQDPRSLGVGPLRGGLDGMRPDDWERVLQALFRAVARPMTLDDIVELAALVANVRDVREEFDDSERDAASALDALAAGGATDDDLDLRAALEHIWNAIAALSLRQRRAFVLNCRDDELELDLFWYHEIASVGAIGRAVALTVDEFATVWVLLSLDEAARARALALPTDEHRFMTVWPRLPLSAVQLATLMRTGEPMIWKLRSQARTQIRARCRALLVGADR